MDLESVAAASPWTAPAPMIVNLGDPVAAVSKTAGLKPPCLGGGAHCDPLAVLTVLCGRQRRRRCRRRRRRRRRDTGDRGTGDRCVLCGGRFD
jgi:hypothetical protein